MQIVERMCELRAVLPDMAMQKLVGDLETLPSAPASYWELINALGKPNVSISNVCRIVERDPALHAKVLQIANSAFFGLSQRVGSVSSAVNYLGLELIKALSVSSRVFAAALATPVIPGFSIEKLQTEGLLVGELAKLLVTDAKTGDDAFTAGFLRDVGQMILAVRAPKRFAEALRLAARSKRPLQLVEQELLGASHAEVGSFLLATWGLPAAIVKAVAHHHQVEAARETGGVAPAVYLAELLMREASSRAEPGDNEALETLGSPEELKRWREIAEQTIRRRTKTK
jgi:HD-like signal output (HDOD) protein